ncbi:MAG: hypothetical protein ACR2QJ_05040, partial [Geminicoccaceae bacterium]
ILFFTNLAGITIAAALIFVVNGYGHWKKAIAGILITAAAASLVIHPLDMSLRKLYLRSLILTEIGQLIANSPELYSGKTRLQSMDISHRDEALIVKIDMLVPRANIHLASQRLDTLYQELSKRHQQTFELNVDIIPIDISTIRIGPTNELETR